MASFLPDTDSEDELPVGWEERATLDGKVYYANHTTQTTQWTHPKTGKKKKISGELPFGWVKEVQQDGTVIFTDTINNKTTFTDPRLAFAVEEKDATNELQQHFDSSSTALQVLHGRDLSGKVVIVTGGNCGIGYETCRALSFHGAHVIMACRDLDKGNCAIEKITSERTHCKLTALQLDLESLKSVREFVDNFERMELPLHMLILNAGVFGLPHCMTEDGFERTFQVNHLSNFLLVQLLEKHLLTSAPSRVIVVSSESHRFSFLTPENISHEYLSPSSWYRFVPMVAYNDSKLCNVLFASQLNRRLAKHKVVCYSVHPGNLISTSLSRNWWFYRLLFAAVRPFTKSPEQGASTTVYAATSLDLESLGGLYLNNCCRCNPSKSAQDVKLAQLLWTLSDKMIEGTLQPKPKSKIELSQVD